MLDGSGLIEARKVARNPIHPYTWVALYNDGGGLKQYGEDGVYHSSLEIDCERVDSLMIWGHPASPIVIPKPELGGEKPERVVIKATVTMERPWNSQAWYYQVDMFFGFIMRDDNYLLLIDHQGKLYRTNTEWLQPDAPGKQWRQGEY